MSMFGAIHTAASALTVSRTWLDAVSDNIANLDTVRPTSGPAFQQRIVVASSVGPQGPGDAVGNGVQVAGIAYGSAAGRLVSDPTSPLADARGLVRAPDTDLGDQMVELMVAQRMYQSNLAVIDRARDAYQQAMSVGR
jgi:flagellar basal-body rod protein FlgC